MLALPLMLLVALAIRLTSPGPVLYHQQRVGQHGRIFIVHKFRSMRQDAEADTGAVWAQANDPRVTPIGRFLRRTRLDELPQLWNVLVGDMSFVGPRPERPEFVEELTKQIPFYGQRHVVKPGLTGWAQVRYTYGASVEDAMEKLQYDLFYIKNLSMRSDIYIIARDDQDRPRSERFMRRSARTSILLAVALFTWFAHASILAAQNRPQQPDRPYRGLFGGVQRDPSRERSLDFNLSLSGGYDSNLPAAGSGSGDIGDPRIEESGGLGTAFADIAFRRGRNENWVSGGANATFRYYPSLPEINATDYAANVRFSARPGGRAMLYVGQDASYRTLFSLYGVPIFETAVGEAAPRPPTIDYAFGERPTLLYNSVVNTNYDIGRRTHLRAGYTFAGLRATAEDYESRLQQHDGRLGLARDLSRRWTVGGRYTYSDGHNVYQGLGTRTRSHQAEAVFDYRRTLRSRRQLTFGFAPGYDRMTTEGDAVETWVERRVSASVQAGIGLTRAWTLNGNYRRGLRYLPGIRQPLFADDVGLTLDGYLGRRLDLAFVGLYSNSESGQGGLYTGYKSFSGNGRVRFALNQSTALSGGYVFYRYEFGPDTVLPAGMPQRYNRHAVRIGVDFWLPLHR